MYNRPIPRLERPDDFNQSTFGPYAAADFASTNNYKLLPFFNTRDTIIDEVAIVVTGPSAAVSSVDAVSFNLAKVDPATATANQAAANKFGTITTATGAITAANRVTKAVNIGDDTAGGAPDIEVHVMKQLSIFPDTDATAANQCNNVLKAGGHLYAYTDVAATALVGLYITVKWRERLV